MQEGGLAYEYSLDTWLRSRVLEQCQIKSWWTPGVAGDLGAAVVLVLCVLVHSEF